MHYELYSKATSKTTRRPHQKSRGGCVECKRRRKKCDELKPSCTRCILGLHRCAYPATTLPLVTRIDDPVPPATPACPPPNGFPLPVYPDQATDSTAYSNDPLAANSLPVNDLYNYYLEHVLPSSNTSHSSCMLPATDLLAQESRLLLDSLLAVSAVRLACDMISQGPPPEISTVRKVLLRGYHHYNKASKSMRMKLSQSSRTNADQILIGTLNLLPFAAASQQISHWLSTQNRNLRSHIPLSSTPRDVITFVRGARTIMEVLFPAGSIPWTNVLTDVIQVSTVATGKYLTASKLLYKQIIESKIISGSQEAWSELQARLDVLSYGANDPPDQEALTCKAAFGVLVDLRSSVIAVLNSSAQLRIRRISSKDATDWLDSCVHWPCIVQSVPVVAAEPLTHCLLSFYAQVPQSYLDLVLPLLDQRLERPVGESSDWFALNLTRTQALALDIYAHWSVLMFLASDESWWIGDLPKVTLTGLVNRYGTDFVKRLWSGCATQEEWWPAKMLKRLGDVQTT